MLVNVAGMDFNLPSLSRKGQITLPVHLCKKQKWGEGTKFLYRVLPCGALVLVEYHQDMGLRNVRELMGYSNENIFSERLRKALEEDDAKRTTGGDKQENILRDKDNDAEL